LKDVRLEVNNICVDCCCLRDCWVVENDSPPQRGVALLQTLWWSN